MTWTTWGIYVITAAVLAISPGPAVFLVIAQALQGGFKKGMWGGLGILSVNALFFGLSAVGLTAMLTASTQLFTAVKWIGSAYLLFLGLQTFFGKGNLALNTVGDKESSSPKLEPGWRWRTYGRGVVLQMSNPKAILFVTALLPQFIRPGEDVVTQVMILGASSIGPELFILAGYSLLAGQLSHMSRRPRFMNVTNKVSGALLAGAGAGLAFIGEE